MNAFNRSQAARTAYLRHEHEASITNAELFVDQWTAFKLADALQMMLDTRPV